MTINKTDRLGLRVPDIGTLNWGDEINDNTEISSSILSNIQLGNGVRFGLAASDGGTLQLDYEAGVAKVGGVGFIIPASNKTATALTGDSTVQRNFLYVDSSGVVQISTVAPSGDYTLLAMADCDAIEIVAVYDCRYILQALLPQSFDTVADMVASTTLIVGDTVRTLGYWAVGDGGGNDYSIVAAATGIEDLGKYIDLDTHQALGLFVNGGVVFASQFGTRGDGIIEDTTALNKVSIFCATYGYKLRLAQSHLVTQWLIPSGLLCEGISDGENRATKILQKTGETISAVKSEGATFAGANRNINLKRLYIQSQTGSNSSIGFELANVVLSNFSDIEILGFEKGFLFRQVNDCSFGSVFRSRNCDYGGEILAGPDDNSNNLTFNHLHIETFAKYGLDITGTGSGALSNNKLHFGRLKLEAAFPGAATHGLRIYKSETITIDHLDTVTVNTAPPVGYKPLDIEDSASLFIGFVELREQTSTALTRMVNIENSNNIYIAFNYYLGIDVIDEVITVNNANCSNITLKLLKAINVVAASITNLTSSSGMITSGSSQLRNDLELARAGEISLKFTRELTGDSYTLGRIDGSGNWRIMYGETQLFVISSGGIVTCSTSDFKTTTASKGLVVKTPDGTKNYRIRVDNSGNVVTDLV